MAAKTEEKAEAKAKAKAEARAEAEAKAASVAEEVVETETETETAETETAETETEAEVDEDETVSDTPKVCLAQTYILYNSTQYKPGDKLPTNDPKMLKAWLEARTAAWVDEDIVKSAKAQSVTAMTGLCGQAVCSDSDNGEDLVGRVPINNGRRK